jgi:hypothetical protein
MKIIATKTDKDIAKEYANKFISSKKSLKNFGNKSVLRSFDRQYNDAYLGRLGEILFSNMLQKYGYKLFFDEEIRVGSNVGDGCKDIVGFKIDNSMFQTNAKIDIKSTNGNWLLVETHRFDADAYVLLTIKNDCAEYRGYALEEDFFGFQRPKYEYKSGDKLRNAFDTSKFLNVTLDAPHQFGLPSSELRVGGFVDYLQKNSIEIA